MTHDIALLEDEPDLRELVTEVLESRGYRVRSFGRVTEAAALLELPPDLFITDLTLPDGDALGLLEQLRRLHPDLPVLVVSGRAGEEDLLAGFAAGATDYITKPLSLSELQAKCTVLLSRAGRRPSGGERRGREDDLPGGREAAFGRYRVLGVLGQGGAGVVFDAVDARTGAPVALKVLPAAAALAPDARQRFVREAYTLSLVRSPHVVGVLDFGTGEGRSYYAMERVDGAPLTEHVATHGPLGEPEALALLRGLARALRAVHDAGLIHRDLKPSNVLLRGGRAEAPVLIDFGLAKHPHDRTLTATGSLVGTPAYLPPEAVRGHPLDACSDLFALGLVIRFALTGEDPFPDCELFELLRALVTRRVPLPEGLSPPLADALARLTDPDPAGRPRSAGELLRLVPEPKPERPRPPLD